MELKITRVFHPVGQGAFYSERHFGPNGEPFNIVYDCGSLSAKGRKLENKIKGSMAVGTVIDILFLSHFDEDHVSGVEFLKKHFEVKTVIIPLIDDEAKLYAKLSRYLNTGTIDNTIVDDPHAFFGDGIKVVYVLPTGFSPEEDSRIPDDNTGENTSPRSVESLGNRDHIASGARITGLNTKADWGFMPYNYRQPERSGIFRNLLKEHELEPAELAEIKNIVKHKKLLNELYKEVRGSININSMAVYSGPLSLNEKAESFGGSWGTPLYYMDYPGYTGAACLYLGDIDLTISGLINDLMWRIGSLDNNLYTVQIPHHGAIGNYSPEIFNRKLKHAAISYGTTNSWGHPSDHVVIDCMFHCRVSLISEYSDSIAIGHFIFK